MASLDLPGASAGGRYAAGPVMVCRSGDAGLVWVSRTAEVSQTFG